MRRQSHSHPHHHSYSHSHSYYHPHFRFYRLSDQMFFFSLHLVMFFCFFKGGCFESFDEPFIAEKHRFSSEFSEFNYKEIIIENSEK